MSNDLKPCPFCGSPNIRAINSQLAHVWLVACKNCGSQIGNSHTYEAARTKWNNRA